MSSKSYKIIKEIEPPVLVMIGEHSVDVRIDHVAIDNVLAARTAVGHLVEIGRRRIAAIGRARWPFVICGRLGRLGLFRGRFRGRPR